MQRSIGLHNVCSEIVTGLTSSKSAASAAVDGQLVYATPSLNLSAFLAIQQSRIKALVRASYQRLPASREVAGPAAYYHGAAFGYTKYGCRCRKCALAHARSFHGHRLKPRRYTDRVRSAA